MEKDNEINGDNNSYTTYFRQYDPRIGRWTSIDPKPNPSISPYAAFANNPLVYIDTYGDTISLSKMFLDSKYYDYYQDWMQTESGHQFQSDYGLGGKYEHVNILFDATLEGGYDAGATSFEVETKEGERLTLVSVEAFGRLSARGRNMNNTTTQLNEGDRLFVTIDVPFIERTAPTQDVVEAFGGLEKYLRSQALGAAFGVNTLIHEGQHASLNVESLFDSGRRTPPGYDHDRILPINGQLYEDRKEAVESLYGEELRRTYREFPRNETYEDWLYQRMEGREP